MNEDRPVGEIFNHPGHHEKLIVAKAYGCDFCIRRAYGCADELTGACAANHRSDKLSVQFVLLSKHAVYKLLGDYDTAQQAIKSR